MKTFDFTSQDSLYDVATEIGWDTNTLVTFLGITEKDDDKTLEQVGFTADQVREALAISADYPN